jgi:hypothetical protein
MGMDMNAEIAEKIMGWEVYRAERTYRDPKQLDHGVLEKLPDFLMREHGLLRETMKSRGYELTVIENPTDFKEGRGKTFTASFSRPNESSETTQPDERQAVCVAALKACGFQISNDQ